MIDPTQHCKNWYAEHIGAFARQAKSDPYVIDPRARSTALSAPQALGRLTGRVLECLQGGPGSLLDGSQPLLTPPGASQDQPWGVIWASIRRPERVRTLPRNGRGRPRQPQIDFSLILGRFGTDFHQSSNDFSSIFARADCDEATASEAQKRVVRSSPPDLALALCSRFVLLVRLSK